MKLIITLVCLLFLAFVLPAGVGLAVAAILIGAWIYQAAQGNNPILTGAAVGAWWGFGLYFAAFVLVGYLLSATVLGLVSALADRAEGFGRNLARQARQE